MILRCPTCSPCTTWIITFQMVLSVVLCRQSHHLRLHSLLMRLLRVLSIPLVAFLDICIKISLYPQHGVGLAFLVPLLVWLFKQYAFSGLQFISYLYLSVIWVVRNAIAPGLRVARCDAMGSYPRSWVASSLYLPRLITGPISNSTRSDFHGLV